MTTTTLPPLPEPALSALIGVQRRGLKAWLKAWEPLVEHIEQLPRAQLLRRVTPPGDLSGLSERDVSVLGILLDGEPWSRSALSARLHVPDRHVRRAVEALRHAGFPVVSRSTAGAGGYRLTADPDEIESYIDREVTPRAMRQHEIDKAMRQAAQRCRASEDEGAVQPSQLPVRDFDPSGGCGN